MLRVYSAVSGEEIAVLDAEEFVGKEAKVMKQFLATLTGCSRFRQKLFSRDTVEIRDDDVVLTDDVLLVKLDFERSGEQGMAAISACCTKDDVKGLEQLLRLPHDPNEKDTQGCTALHYGARSGGCQCVTLLLEARADVDANDASGGDRNLGPTALHMAALQGQLDVVRILLEAGAEKDKTTTSGMTPLHCAACNGFVEVVRFLVEAGVEMDKASNDGMTAMHAAAFQGRVEVIR